MNVTVNLAVKLETFSSVYFSEFVNSVTVISDFFFWSLYFSGRLISHLFIPTGFSCLLRYFFEFYEKYIFDKKNEQYMFKLSVFQNIHI